MDKIEIKSSEYKYLELTVEYVYRASFNDTYYLETIYLDLADLNKDGLTWIDPYNKGARLVIRL